MKDLEHIDQIHLDAAEGWLGLGDSNSASDELEEITPRFRAHPSVLLVRCQLYQATKKWDDLTTISQNLVARLPNLAEAWIHRSYALHELKRTQEAFDLLLPAAGKFPSIWTIQYNLACYSCQLGNLKDAMTRLKQAIALEGKSQDIRLNALEDPDLKPLWDKIREI